MGRRIPAHAVTFAILFCGASVACRSSSKTDASQNDAAAAVTAAPASPVPVDSASTASAVLAAANEVAAEAVAEAPNDAGVDGGKRKRRRIADAGAVNEAVQAAPATPEPPPAEPVASGRRPAAMGNEQPYGASATSGSPVLKKAPLPGEDPWK